MQVTPELSHFVALRINLFVQTSSTSAVYASHNLHLWSIAEAKAITLIFAKQESLTCCSLMQLGGSMSEAQCSGIQGVLVKHFDKRPTAAVECVPWWWAMARQAWSCSSCRAWISSRHALCHPASHSNIIKAMHPKLMGCVSSAVL